MTKAISKQRIVRSCIEGIGDAQRAYYAWSGDYWLWRAPEYMATVFVARKIAATTEVKYVTIENGATSAMEDAGARGRGRLQGAMRPNGRFDILIWWGNGTPRAPIEVKRHVTGPKALEKDLVRIKSVILKHLGKSSFQFGAVVFFSSCMDGKKRSAKEILHARLDRIEKGAKDVVGAKCRVHMDRSIIRIEEDSAWASACIVIRQLAKKSPKK